MSDMLVHFPDALTMSPPGTVLLGTTGLVESSPAGHFDPGPAGHVEVPPGGFVEPGPAGHVDVAPGATNEIAPGGHVDIPVPPGSSALYFIPEDISGHIIQEIV